MKLNKSISHYLWLRHSIFSFLKLALEMYPHEMKNDIHKERNFLFSLCLLVEFCATSSMESSTREPVMKLTAGTGCACSPSASIVKLAEEKNQLCVNFKPFLQPERVSIHPSFTAPYRHSTVRTALCTVCAQSFALSD